MSCSLFSTSKNGLQKTLEAQFLANQVQLYYTTADAKRFALVKQFNLSPATFNYEHLIEQLQGSGVEPKSREVSS